MASRCLLWNVGGGIRRVFWMRADGTGAASPVNPGFRVGIHKCCREVGRNLEGDTSITT